jgi:RHS repeat-associated protein
VGAEGTTHHVDGLGRLSSRDLRGGVLFRHLDGLGSVRTVTDGTGAVVDILSYAPFGAPNAGNPTFGFTGEPHDSGALLHLRARDYHTGLGRFLTMDPLPGWPEHPLTRNPYTYVLNNPANYTDPSGECVWGLPCPSPLAAVGEQVSRAVNAAKQAVDAIVQGARDLWSSLTESSSGKEGVIDQRHLDYRDRVGGSLIGQAGGNLLSDKGAGIIARTVRGSSATRARGSSPGTARGSSPGTARGSSATRARGSSGRPAGTSSDRRGATDARSSQDGGQRLLPHVGPRPPGRRAGRGHRPAGDGFDHLRRGRVDGCSRRPSSGARLGHQHPPGAVRHRRG